MSGPHPCALEEALVELEDALPAGWCWSVTHVPSLGQWGGTTSPLPAGIPLTAADLLQTDTCRSMTEAVRALTDLLRQRRRIA